MTAISASNLTSVGSVRGGDAELPLMLVLLPEDIDPAKSADKVPMRMKLAAS